MVLGKYSTAPSSPQILQIKWMLHYNHVKSYTCPEQLHNLSFRVFLLAFDVDQYYNEICYSDAIPLCMEDLHVKVVSNRRDSNGLDSVIPYMFVFE